MRKFIFFLFVLFGIAIGFLFAYREDWIARIVMMAMGALFGIAVGGGLTCIGSRRLSREPSWLNEPPGHGTPEDELLRNYWRDRGRPPFMKPPDAELDKHMFDPDRLN